MSSPDNEMFSRKYASSTAEVQAAYDRLYGQRWMYPRVSLFTWLVRVLDAQPGQTLLDVACGDAQLRRVAREAGLVYYGVDISPMAVQAAHYPEMLVGDGTRLPLPDNCFDFVTSIGSLEHYLDMSQGVREIRRVLNPNGLACMLVPNAFSLTWNLLHVWRTGDLADDDGQPIQRFSTRGAWERLLVENGLQIRRTLGYERTWPQTGAEWRFYLTQPKEALLALLAPFLSLNLKRCFVFLCAK